MKQLLWLIPFLAFSQAPDSQAVISKRTVAEYTPDAKAAGFEGTSVLYVEVLPTGKAGSVSVLQKIGLGLDEAAIKAVKDFEFQAAVTKGEPSVSWAVVEVPFSLGKGPVLQLRRSSYQTTLRRGERAELVEPRLMVYKAPPGACGDNAESATVRFGISAEGETVAVSGDSNSNESAVEAVKAWHFAPGTANGEPREGTGVAQFDCTAPQSSVENGQFRVGGDVKPPVVIFKMNPEYSEEARLAKFSGTALLSVVVDRDGRASDFRVVKPVGLGLDEKAIAAVLRWRFKPGERNGVPVRVRATIEVNFRLL